MVVMLGAAYSSSQQRKRAPASRLRASRSLHAPSALNASVALLLAPLVIFSLLIHRFCFRKRSSSSSSSTHGNAPRVVGTAKPRRDYKVSRLRGNGTGRSQQQQHSKRKGAATPASGLGSTTPAEHEQTFLQVLQQMKLHAMEAHGDGGPTMLTPLDAAGVGAAGQLALDDWADSWAPDLDPGYGQMAPLDDDDDVDDDDVDDDGGGYFYDDEEDEEEEGGDLENFGLGPADAGAAVAYMDALGAQLGKQLGRLELGDGRGDGDGEEDWPFDEEELDEMMAGMMAGDGMAGGPPMDDFLFGPDEEDDDYGDYLDEYETDDDEGWEEDDGLDVGAAAESQPAAAPGAPGAGSSVGSAAPAAAPAVQAWPWGARRR